MNSDTRPKGPSDGGPVIPLTENKIKELRAEVLKADEIMRRILAEQKTKPEQK